MTAMIKPVLGNTEQSRDAALLLRISNGDEAALGLLYDCHRTTVFGLLISILNNRAAAENILEEVFVQIWQEAKNLQTMRAKVFTRLVTIARSKALEQAVSLKTPIRRNREEPVVETVCLSLKPEPNPMLTKRQTLTRTALSQLPPNQKSLLLKAFFEGCSQQEIAARENIPLQTIAIGMQMGMTKLRGIFNAELTD